MVRIEAAAKFWRRLQAFVIVSRPNWAGAACIGLIRRRGLSVWVSASLFLDSGRIADMIAGWRCYVEIGYGLEPAGE